jgi:hypothetical protein
LNGSEGLVQMIDLKNFYSMKLELGDRNDTAMSRIAELIRQAYAERGIDAVFAKRGDEFYVCMRLARGTESASMPRWWTASTVL